MCGKCQPVAAPPVLFEDEELLHPVPVGLSNDRRRDQREPGIATFDESNVSKVALCEDRFFEVVAVLAPGIQILIPDVRQLVLGELQHSAEGSEVVRGSKTALKRQRDSPLRPKISIRRQSGLSKESQTGGLSAMASPSAKDRQDVVAAYRVEPSLKTKNGKAAAGA